MTVDLYVLVPISACLVSWIGGCLVGRALLRREMSEQLDHMRMRYEVACKTAETWRDEVEVLAARVKEDDDGKG